MNSLRPHLLRDAQRSQRRLCIGVLKPRLDHLDDLCRTWTLAYVGDFEQLHVGHDGADEPAAIPERTNKALEVRHHAVPVWPALQIRLPRESRQLLGVAASPDSVDVHDDLGKCRVANLPLAGVCRRSLLTTVGREGEQVECITNEPARGATQNTRDDATQAFDIAERLRQLLHVRRETLVT